MHQSRIFVPSRLALSQPLCLKCGAGMWLASLEPDRPGYDMRSFECSKCEVAFTETVKSGLQEPKSAA